ncbi:DNA-directed primase/polymerase protein [Trifolium repens]|nr:DNA-directed primase/polymerase protein [Trifolium repens]
MRFKSSITSLTDKSEEVIDYTPKRSLCQKQELNQHSWIDALSAKKTTTSAKHLKKYKFNRHNTLPLNILTFANCTTTIGKPLIHFPIFLFNSST